MSINQDLWSAKLPNGDVRSGTLEQLNEAFRSGYLGESTLVRAARSETWTKLADVLAGVAPGAAAAVAPPPSPSVPAPAADAGVAAAAAPPPSPSVPAPAADAGVAAAAAPPPSASVPAPAADAGGAPTAAPAPHASVPAPAADTRSASARINVRPELWQVRLANGEVGSGTYQQLEEAFDAGHLSEEAFVLAAGTREWVRLGTIMRHGEPPPDVLVPSKPPQRPSAAAQPVASPATIATPAAPTPAQSDSSDELWQVRLADGQVRSGTRQQLEEAFSAGHLDESALVLAAGASEWVTLGSLADRDLSAPLPAPVASAEPSSIEAQPPSPDSPDAALPQAAVSAFDDPAAAPPARDAAPPAPPVPAEDEKTDAQIAEGSDTLWEVKLTGKQLAAAFHTGLLDDDALVLASGTEQWRTLGDVRAAQSLPSRVPPAAKSSASSLSS